MCGNTWQLAHWLTVVFKKPSRSNRTSGETQGDLGEAAVAAAAEVAAAVVEAPQGLSETAEKQTLGLIDQPGHMSTAGGLVFKRVNPSPVYK